LEDVINHTTTGAGRSELSVDIGRPRMLGMLQK